MSLATRCTSCGTIFKVVQDQLRVSEGWVRCGRCQQVFNALEGLFDLERDPPPQRRTDTAAPAAAAAAPAGDPVAAESAPTVPSGAVTQRRPPASAALDGGDVPAPAEQSIATAAVAITADESATADWSDVPATHEDDALDSRWLVRPARDGRSARERHAPRDPDSDFTDARFPNDAVLEEADGGPVHVETEGGPKPMPPIPPRASRRVRLGRANDKRSADDTPAFVRRAKRQAQWRHPVVRATLGLTALALLALLGLQSAVVFRDWIAAYQPASRPYLMQLCEVAGCRVAPLARIDALAVDSVTLLRRGAPGNGDSAYRLMVGIHNASPVALAAPHLELSLTDADGQLVSRRVLTPIDMGVRAATLPAQQSTTVQASVRTSGPRIAGYTVELFYP